MRLERKDDLIIVWETGRKNNAIIYTSDEDLEGSELSRGILTNIETLLRKNGEFDEAARIKNFIGKVIRVNTIPKVIPTGNYNINTRLNYLDETIERYIEEYGLDLDPDFQRGHVWTDEQRLRYVEFILQGGKSNPIYFNHENWMGSFEGEMVIVDGKQRLTSLLMFLNDEILVFKDLDPEGIGYRKSEFDNITQNIEIVINDLPSKEQVLMWYLQINTGNVAHTDEELHRVEQLLLEQRRT